MLYFFHHYELPLILRQVQLQNMLIRTANSSTATGGTPNAAPSATAAAAAAAAATAASAERSGASRTEAEVDGNETLMESETMDLDSDWLRPETPSEVDSAEMDVASVANTAGSGGTVEQRPDPTAVA